MKIHTNAQETRITDEIYAQIERGEFDLMEYNDDPGMYRLCVADKLGINLVEPDNEPDEETVVGFAGGFERINRKGSFGSTKTQRNFADKFAGKLRTDERKAQRKAKSARNAWD